MKRTTTDPTASNRSGNNPPPQTNEENDIHAQNEGNWYNPKMKEKGGKVKPLTPEEMEARLFLTLASQSEIEKKKTYIKIGIPDFKNFVLPCDITTKIASFIPSRNDQSYFALTNRQNYISLDMAYPLRRFPGLVGDLKRTCQGVKMANFDLMKRFDDHIKSEGGYDKVLLTPLSPLSRLSIAIAMMEWAQNQTLKADKPACIKLAQERLLTEFTSLKSNSAIKPIELRDMLLVAIRSVLTAPAGKTNRKRSLVFTMAIGKQIMDLLKGDLLDEATQREIFFEVLKMNPTDEKNIDYLENEASRWSLEHLAVAMMFKPSPLLFHRLTELSPTERPAAVAKIIQAMQTTPHVVSLSIYAKNILHVCGMCLATLTHELTSDTESLITSIIELFRDIANETSLPRNQKTFAESPPFRISSIPQDHELREIQSGYEMGDPLNSPKANMVVKDTYPRIYNLPFVYKGYVYRRMTDWIKVLPDRGFAHEMASALSTSFNFFTPDTPD